MRKLLFITVMLGQFGLLKADDLIRNGDFTDGMKYWSIRHFSPIGKVATAKVIKHALVVFIPRNCTERNAFSYQFMQKINPVVKESYLISFVTVSKQNTSFDLSYRTTKKIKNLGFAKRVKVPKGKMTHFFSFTPQNPIPSGDEAVMAFQLGIARGRIAFSRIKIIKADISQRRQLPFSSRWKVFFSVKSPNNMAQIPETLSKQNGDMVKPITLSGKKTTLDVKGTTIALDQMKRNFAENDIALLFNEFESPEDTIYYAGAAADWYMELYHNGEIVCSTMKRGNGMHSFSPNDHCFYLPVKKGRNVFVAKVLSGSKGWRFNWGSPKPPSLPVRFIAGKDYQPVDMSSVVIQPDSALDLSALIDAPAGKYGRVVINSQGLFAFEKQPDKPVRFFGYSSSIPAQVWQKVESDAQFKENVVRYAQASRRQGYNFFRMHGVDHWTMLDSNKELEFSAKYLDRWDYIIHEMKKQGTYFQYVIFSFNLYGGKDDFKTTFNNRNAHKLMLYAGRQQERKRFKKGATFLLNHVNPYTKLAWKDDPAIAVVEFYNEQYAAFATLNGIKVKQPEAYKYFVKKFQSFLKQRYRRTVKHKLPKEIIQVGFDNIEIPDGASSRKLSNDYALFRMKLVKECNLWCTKVLREAGYKGIITQNSNYSLLNAAAAYQTLPAVDCHSYYKHPSNWSAKNSIVGQESAAAGCANYFRSLNSMRLYNRPFLVGEYNHCFWNPFQHELPLVFTAYAAFQNFSTLAIHSDPVYLYIDRPGVACFEVGLSAVQRAGEFLAFMLFKRGDITPAKQYATLDISKDYLMRDSNAAHGISSEQNKLALMLGFGLNFPDLTPFRKLRNKRKPVLSIQPTGATKVNGGDWASTLIETKDNSFDLSGLVKSMKKRGILPSENLTNPSKKIFQNESGEITLRARESLIKVVTPKSEAVSLLANQGEKLDALNLKKTSVDALVGITTLDDLPLRESKRMILIYSTVMANTNMELDVERGTLFNRGEAPALMRTGTFSIELKNANANKLKCHVLRIDGKRLQKLPAIVKNGRFCITIDTSSLAVGPTPFFELSVED